MTDWVRLAGFGPARCGWEGLGRAGTGGNSSGGGIKTGRILPQPQRSMATAGPLEDGLRQPLQNAGSANWLPECQVTSWNQEFTRLLSK